MVGCYFMFWILLHVVDFTNYTENFFLPGIVVEVRKRNLIMKNMSAAKLNYFNIAWPCVEDT